MKKLQPNMDMDYQISIISGSYIWLDIDNTQVTTVKAGVWHKHPHKPSENYSTKVQLFGENIGKCRFYGQKP